METAPLVYLRGHGPAGDYRGSYPDAVLAHWARRIEAAASAGSEVHCYFDNDIGADAPRDARRLRDMVVHP